MGEYTTVVLAFGAVVGLIMLFAQVKLFSINTRLAEAVQQLRLLTNEVAEMRSDAKKASPPAKT